MCSNPCVGPLPKMKISFFLLSIFVEELMSAPKVIIFLPVSLLGCEKNPSLSNPISYPEYFSHQDQHFQSHLLHQRNNFPVFDNR